MSTAHPSRLQLPHQRETTHPLRLRPHRLQPAATSASTAAAAAAAASASTSAAAASVGVEAGATTPGKGRI